MSTGWTFWFLVKGTHAVTGLIAAAVAWSATGCGAEADQEHGAVGKVQASPVAGTPTTVDMGPIRLLRSTMEAKQFPDAGALARVRDVALVGTVGAIRPGPAVITPAWPGVRSRENNVVIEVRVKLAIKSIPGSVVDGAAYVSFPRGVNEIDDSGAVTGRDLNPSVADLQAAVPVGTPVLVVADKDERATSTVGEVAPGVPAGAVLLSGFHPQQLTFSQGGSALDAWPGETFASLVAGLS